MSYLSVVDHLGRKIPTASLSSGGRVYEGAGTGRRMSTWGLSSAGPNTAMWGSLSALRSRVRELRRNNPNANGGVESYVSNLIGTGITPEWQLDDADLKERIHTLWEDSVSEMDADGTSDFYGLQALAATGVIESGEILARLVPRPSTEDLAVPLQIKLLEADHLDETYESVAPNGNMIRMGIEYDAEGRRAAYWPFKDHPGEQFLGAKSTDRVRVPASEMLHVFLPHRPGQQRGLPWLSSIIMRLYELDQYEDAELVRKKAAALIGGWIKEPPGQSGLGINPLGTANTTEDPFGRELVAMEPGTYGKLPPGWDVVNSQPADVGPNFIEWVKQNLREIATGIGITYEQLTGDLSGVTFSSIRAGLNEFRRRCEMLIWRVFVFQFCRPFARRWMDVAVASGRLAIPGYLANRRLYNRVEWNPCAWEYVNPVDDVMTDILSCRAHFTSRTKVIRKRGYDRQSIDREIEQENKTADEKGFVSDCDPRKTAKSGSQQDAEKKAVTTTRN